MVRVWGYRMIRGAGSEGRDFMGAGIREMPEGSRGVKGQLNNFIFWVRYGESSGGKW